ncbi:MAG: hypothetical protein M3303_02990 [Gemmatimonadota bacterium]|nr:hypothetical protein [Gemmatimonadota bacterium]
MPAALARRVPLSVFLPQLFTTLKAYDRRQFSALTDVVRRSRGDGTLVLLSELQPQPLATLRRSVFVDVIGEENICATMEEAVARAHEELEVRRLLGRGSGHREAVA